MNSDNMIETSQEDLSKNILHKMKGQWTQHWDVFIFLILASAKVLHYGKLISPEYFSVAFLQPPIIASLLPIVAIAFLFKENRRVWFLYAVNVILSISLFADTVYYHYFKDIISVGVIKDSSMLKNTGASVLALVKVTDFFYFIDLIFLIPIIKAMKKVERKQLGIRGRWIFCLFLFTLGVFLDGNLIYKLSVEQPNLITTMSNKLYLTKVLGNVNFHVLDSYNFVVNEVMSSSKLSEERTEEIQVFLQNKDKSPQANLMGAGNKKNLIMIQVEALQQFVINKKVNNQEITPNLNRWIGKSLYFDNFFYQVAGGNTSDAEFMTNNSLYPAASGAAYYKYTGDNLNSLPRALKDIGYSTSAFHGYVEGFWNRNVMYQSEGFDKFYGERSFKFDDRVGLGLSDKTFLNQSFEKIKEMQQPFYSFLVTLSSHFPYDDVKGYGNFDVGSYTNTLLGNYLGGIHYADEQLGMFLEKLEKEGFMDNSIIVIYGDHYAIPKGDVKQLYEFEGVSNPSELQWIQYQKVPMLIHFPKDMNKGVNHSYACQMDVYPTLSNLFNLSNDYLLGKDILNNEEHRVIFRNGSFIDDKIYYLSGSDTYYDVKTGDKVNETPELKSIKEQVLNELKYSDDILEHDLIQVLDVEPGN